MEKIVTLKDGRDITIRDVTHDDLHRLHAFFSQLPAEDRRFLRVDVTRIEVLEQRFRDMDAGRIQRLVAIDDDEVVADGALELSEHGWKDGTGEIRIHVARSHQRLGLGTLMAREVYFLAAKVKVTRIVARMMRPQTGAQRIFHRLGFREEFLIPDHVRDQTGAWQDMVLMRCDLDDLWKEIEHLMAESDWQRHR
jgi:RimJ/RimL family protein N-acetyltransferase